MNSKQLLLTTALITSLPSIAIAEVSISGEAKVNTKGGSYIIETDLTITGELGGTLVVAKIGVDNSNEVEQLYMTSNVAGIDIKAGRWKSGKSELGWDGGNFENRVSATTSFGGVELVYQDFSGASGTSVTVAGTIGGVKVMHKVGPVGISNTKVSSSMGGVNAEFYTKDFTSVGAGGNNTAVTLSTEVRDLTLTYVDVKSTSGVSMDGFIGKEVDVKEANAFGVSTNILGNKITYKDIMINRFGAGEEKLIKLILTRKIASGTTFEATYRDIEDGMLTDLDLELAVKF